MPDETTREAIRRAAVAFTDRPRSGWLCCFGSSHVHGPCKACLRMWERLGVGVPRE